MDARFKILAKAGIPQYEFADMLKVSRQSVNAWVAGRSEPGKTHEVKVVKLLDAIKAACDAGDLPLDEEEFARVRSKAIRAKVRVYLKVK